MQNPINLRCGNIYRGTPVLLSDKRNRSHCLIKKSSFGFVSLIFCSCNTFTVCNAVFKFYASGFEHLAD